MGIYNRDYVREGRGGGDFFAGGGAAACKWLIIANVAVFVLQLLTNNLLTAWLSFDPERVIFGGQVWRLLSYAFCHGGIWHILFNMLFLWWFGKTLEVMYGTREFVAFYLTAAVVAALAFVGLEFLIAGLTNINGLPPMIGASGSIMAIVMVYAIHFPRERIYIWFFIPIEIRWLVLLYIVFDAYPVLLALGGLAPAGNVAHAAHLGGLAFGFAYKKFEWRISSLFGSWRLPRWDRRFGSRRQIRIYDESKKSEAADTVSLDEQVDAILEKISREGEAGLTDREREVLKDASRRYRSR
ncbi:MAG: rhomboid family intramembrane serine protease [Planctomycetaceae bacterium]